MDPLSCRNHTHQRAGGNDSPSRTAPTSSSGEPDCDTYVLPVRYIRCRDNRRSVVVKRKDGLGNLLNVVPGIEVRATVLPQCQQSDCNLASGIRIKWD